MKINKIQRSEIGKEKFYDENFQKFSIQRKPKKQKIGINWNESDMRKYNSENLATKI